MSFSPFVIPAILALTFKAAIFFYARGSKQHNLETQLYLLFLFALSIQNLSEIFVFIGGQARHEMIFVYFGASIIAIAALMHLALATATNWSLKISTANPWPLLIYAPAVVLEMLLFFTDLLVVGIEPMAYTYTKIPGPHYFLFVIYVLTYFGTIPTILMYGGVKLENSTRRARAKLILLGSTPLILVAMTVVILQNYGLRAFNTTITLPITVTFFLAITAYATHQYRIFDIGFFIPWSKVRARKTAFYDRIRAMIAELADLGTVGEATKRLSDTLGCSVALLSSGRPALAVAGSAQQMVDFPTQQLRNINSIVVANEIADAFPDIHNLMRSHGVAAIVPFYPRSQGASGWMLLGDTFSDQVYTPLDFKMVEQLFGKMAELFLDKLLIMRKQIDATLGRMRTLESSLQESEANLVTLQKERDILLQKNMRLTNEHVSNNHESVALMAESHVGTLEDRVAMFERTYIERALKLAGGNKSKAARFLGLRPNTLHYKLERHNITVGKNGSESDK